MVPSLLALCLSFIATNIERWSQHVTEFHIKDAQYLVTPMTKMPQDLVGRILQELVNYKKLNLQNLVLFLDDQLQRIEFPPNLAFVNDATLKVIARLSKNIVSFKPGSCSKLSQVDIIQQFSKLQHINLSNCKAVKLDDAMATVLSRGKLVTLCLRNTAATEKSFSLIPLSHSSLLELDLSQTLVSPSCLLSIMHQCTALRRLHAESCFEIDDSAFVDLTEETNADLQDLNLSICDIHDKSIIKIVARYTALKSLYLEGCPITDRSMKSIATLSDLQILGLINCSYVGDQGLIHLANGKVPLTYLSLSNASKISDKGLEAISESLKKYISHLVLDKCINIGDRGIIAIATKCFQLKLISLVGCTKISDAGVVALVKTCTRLQHLTLDNVPITQISISALAKSGSLATLQSLSLVSCNQIKITDDLVKVVRRVKSCNLSSCAKVTRQDWQKLCTAAPRTNVIWT